MSIEKINSNLPTTTKCETLNDMIIELNGKVSQGKFDKEEIDQLYTDLGVSRKFIRDSEIGHTLTTYTNWTHLQAESGYSIWKIAISDYFHNSENQLFLDDRILVYKGKANAESATTFDNVYTYNGSYVDNSTEAGTDIGTSFTLLSATTDYVYIGLSTTFSGIKFEFETVGSNNTLKIEYYNSSWTELTVNTNTLSDSTGGLIRDGVISWDIPSSWSTLSVNSVTKYWIRISTTTTPITPAKAYYIIPNNSVIGLLALSASEIQDETWVWCSYGQNIYVTIRNTGNSAYEGDYFISSSSSTANKQNYFIYNHTFKMNYETSSFLGDSVATESGVAVGDLVCITDDYTFDLADADSFAKRAIGYLQMNGTVRYVSGLFQEVNTVGNGDIIAGNSVYLSSIGGKVTKTIPTGAGKIQQFIGIAIGDERSANKVDIVANINLLPTIL